jgi:hypothetical protein
MLSVFGHGQSILRSRMWMLRQVVDIEYQLVEKGSVN